MEIHEDDRAITAFVTPDAKFEYCRMPFGLACSPAYLQQLVESVCTGLYPGLVQYADDLCSYGHTFEEALERLELLLERFAACGISLSAEKSVVMATQCRFLGFMVAW